MNKDVLQIEKQMLVNANSINTEKLIQKAGYKKWNVYAKAPFVNVHSLVAYLGRYTKIAITTHRIQVITENSVLFK